MLNSYDLLFYGNWRDHKVQRFDIYFKSLRTIDIENGLMEVQQFLKGIRSAEEDFLHESYGRLMFDMENNERIVASAV